MENNKLDQIFKESLMDAVQQPSDSSWDVLEQKLDQDNNSSNKFIWFLLIIIGFLSIAIFYKYSNHDDSKVIKEISPMAMNELEKQNDAGKIAAIAVTETPLHNILDESIANYVNDYEEVIISVKSVNNPERPVNELQIPADYQTEIGNKAVSKLNKLPVGSRRLLQKDQHLLIKTIKISQQKPESHHSRTLVVNLTKQLKIDTVHMQSPKTNAQTKKSLLATIKELPNEGGLINKIREAKNDILD